MDDSMFSVDKQKQITSAKILEVLGQGCDERIYINPETGRNKYHLKPAEGDDLLQRGSCTANVLTPSGKKVATKLLEEYDTLDYETLVKHQSNRLKTLIQSESQSTFDVFFAPSGSDLVYYPLMFQRLLNPTQKIVNIVSCPQELGSGSLYASEGKFYAQYNQFGDSIPKGELVDPIHEVDIHYLSARADDGVILDRTENFHRLIEKNTDAAIIGSLVLGSKSGIKDDLKIIDPNSDTMWVVDLCQFRVDRPLIHKLLKIGVLVMLTGSKFFQSPPFCAAMLVPRNWCDRLKMVEDTSVMTAFNKIFSAYDLPQSVINLSSKLSRRDNKGLRLRWEIALSEMEAYSVWNFEQTEMIINTWRDGVMQRLMTSQYFELMPDQYKTNPSIISFQVWVNKCALNHKQLKELFETVCIAEHKGFSDGIKRVFFGQPVAYGNKSFIRLAIGSNSIRYFLELGSVMLHNDYRLIEIIEEYAERIFRL